MPIALISAVLLSIAFLVVVIGAASYVIELFGIDTIFGLDNNPDTLEKIVKKIKPPKE
jgi:hypothetical protein